MSMGVLPVAELHDDHRDPHPRQQGEREWNAVMPVELKLGQQVRAGNVQERAGTERQRRARACRSTPAATPKTR